MNTEAAPQFLTTADVARALGVVPDTVRLWERAGKLPALRTASGVRLFAHADVQRLADKREMALAVTR
jgi:excisionase family DNA binding protein